MSLLAAQEEFTVHLTNFSGPFDLLLQLISRHKLDVTEVALSTVTDEFVAHIRQLQASQGASAWDLDQTSSFIVVAATLLDLKAARLLPQGEVEDAEDLALLEARDLLFARLLQYRAFKIVSGWLGRTLAAQARRHPRPGGLEERFASLLPEVELDGFADVIAVLAGRALTPKDPPLVGLEHLHMPLVSVREQAEEIVRRLREHPTATFRALTADASDRLVVVARFLALLELFREKAVGFEQLTPLGELTIRWLGAEVDAERIGAEFDEGRTDVGKDEK
ncbi:segregation and condensation protein A [Propionicimonas sp.]|uniref:segregation and condensation protein A n=1 Tax=Propionicimonas sp. TaxID=1955623 RepID=UPI0039E719B0